MWDRVPLGASATTRRCTKKAEGAKAVILKTAVRAYQMQRRKSCPPALTGKSEAIFRPAGKTVGAMPRKHNTVQPDGMRSRCSLFLIERYPHFSGAAYISPTKQRAGKQLCFSALSFCAAPVVADAPNEALPRAPQGALPRFLPSLSRMKQPRQGLPRPWMGGSRFAVLITAW